MMAKPDSDMEGTICKNCGEKIGCSKCDSFLVHHKAKNRLLCHQCGYTEIFKDKCKSLIEFGFLISEIQFSINF